MTSVASALAYAADVREGRVTVGELLRLAVERDAHDLERWPARSQAEARRLGHPFYFDAQKAALAVEWPGLYCRQYDGEFAGQPLALQPWQAWVEWVTEGWRRMSDGTRRYRHRYLKVGSGNGKTTWMASHATRMTAGDQEPGAECYAVATHRGQALILWNAAARMVEQSPELGRILRVFDSPNNHRITYPAARSFLTPLSRDTTAVSQEGLKPHAVYFDEVHEYRGLAPRKLYDVLRKKGVKRRQPIYSYFTTAGDGDPESLVEELDDYAEDVLRGWADASFEDDTFFAALYQLDHDDDPFAAGLTVEAMLDLVRKANPNLGVSVSVDAVVEHWHRAQHVPAERASFLRYTCNVPAATVQRAIALDYWDAAAETGLWSRRQLEGKTATIGVDLSSTIDLTAVCEHVLDDDGVHCYRWHVFMPEGQLVAREREDQVPYRRWVEEGWLTLIPGERIDYGVIARCVLGVLQRQVVDLPDGLGHDPWHATELCAHLAREGVDVVAIPQFMSSMAEATGLFLDELATGHMAHDGNPLVRWSAGNTCTRQDANGNKVFHKRLSRHRIDPLVAAAMARQRGMTVFGGGSTYDSAEVEASPEEQGSAEAPVLGQGSGGSMYDSIPAELAR